MKPHIKKLISTLMAISLVVPIFSGIQVFAENDDASGTIVPQTQPLTVVGKRIKGDDTYFEISLEVNDDHDQYSSVGVVLRYDPEYIIPAESWDDGAGAADMTDNISWATRRALPTLGMETWSTHTALAYEEADGAGTGASGKRYGYLFLGAEHPLPEPTASPASASDPSDPSGSSDPTPEPTASPTPGTRPVVVARFMYKTDDSATPPITGADMKAKLRKAWVVTGTNSSGVVPATNWDYDWTMNEILTVAGDKVSGESPAQYPFAIYTQDYEEKAYMHSFPTPTPTPAASAAMPISAYDPVIGAGIEAANKLTKDDIKIITCEGESAKATGGLKLSDVFSILFFDWDNSFLGALTAGIGVDVTADVDRYVKSQFVHPDLRTKDYDSLKTAGTITERQYNYRGEYPYTGPAATNPTIPDSVSDYTDKLASGDNNPNAGSLFPLTNKLDYCFAGKDIDTQYPFANGWTAVVTSEPDYSDTTKFPGYVAKTLPTYMETTFTSLDSTQTFGRMPELDTAGQLVDTTLTASDIPDVVSFDFSDVVDMTKSDLDKYYGGNIYLKAVYTPGEMLNKQAVDSTATESNYVATGTLTPTTLVSIATSTTYGFEFEYRRINKYGYGVERANQTSARMDITQIGAASSTPIELILTNKDVLKVLLTPTNFVKTIGYQLVDIYNSNVVTGIKRSLDTELGSVAVGGPEGVGFKARFKPYLEKAKTNEAGAWFPLGDINSFYFVSNSSGTIYNARTFAQAKTKLVTLVGNAGSDYLNLTWYQVQYGLANNGAYVDAATAKTWCESYPVLSENAAKV